MLLTSILIGRQQKKSNVTNEKSPPLQCRLSSKFFDYLLIFGEFIYICSVRYQFHSLLIEGHRPGKTAPIIARFWGTWATLE